METIIVPIIAPIIAPIMVTKNVLAHLDRIMKTIMEVKMVTKNVPAHVRQRAVKSFLFTFLGSVHGVVLNCNSPKQGRISFAPMICVKESMWNDALTSSSKLVAREYPQRPFSVSLHTMVKARPLPISSKEDSPKHLS